ncbi:MAG: translation elongation factor Ts [Phycisphaerales bacterium]|nr:translation elongation factor Ts [Phycisphaerales bacterium]
MTITIEPKSVMTLRQRTGCGMSDCKSALVEAQGDLTAAEKLLREKLKGKMDGRTDRAAGEGCIAVAIDGSKSVIIEVRAETDFTSKNEGFRNMAKDLANAALGQSVGSVSMTSAMTDRLDTVRITTGENISFARGERIDGGTPHSYVHHDGKLGVIVHFQGDVPEELRTGICQHVAANVPTPLAVDAAGVPADLVAQKRADAQTEAEASGKPAEIAAKIAEGKVRKFFEEVTLLGQKYVKDDKQTVSQMLPKGTSVTAFRRVVVGGS